jgi:hypothetical protein
MESKGLREQRAPASTGAGRLAQQQGAGTPQTGRGRRVSTAPPTPLNQDSDYAITQKRATRSDKALSRREQFVARSARGLPDRT